MKISINATCFNNEPSGARNRFIGIYGQLFKNFAEGEFFVFEPKQGRDLIVLDPEVNDYSSSIVEERDGRFSLGTYTLINRDFWESITFD